jgi:hypothetical protein
MMVAPCCNAQQQGQGQQQGRQKMVHEALAHAGNSDCKLTLL